MVAGAAAVNGIAPEADIRVASRWRRHWNPRDQDFSSGGCDFASTHDALQAALKFLSGAGKSGDVILIESQTQSEFLPEEVEPAVFDLIRLITDSGFVVIEPAGNAGLT